LGESYLKFRLVQEFSVREKQSVLRRKLPKSGVDQDHSLKEARVCRSAYSRVRHFERNGVC
jgi:hypothetical protein